MGQQQGLSIRNLDWIPMTSWKSGGLTTSQQLNIHNVYSLSICLMLPLLQSTSITLIAPLPLCCSVLCHDLPDKHFNGPRVHSFFRQERQPVWVLNFPIKGKQITHDTQLPHSYSNMIRKPGSIIKFVLKRLPFEFAFHFFQRE